MGRVEYLAGQIAYGIACNALLATASLVRGDHGAFLIVVSGCGFAAVSFKLRHVSDQPSLGLSVAVVLSWALPILAAMRLARG